MPEDVQEVSFFFIILLSILIFQTMESHGLLCLPLGRRDEETKQIRDLVKELLKNHT